MAEPFRHPYVIALYDTDAAGVLFSANIIRLCHHAWEGMMSELGYGLDRLFKVRTMHLPVVHIEADFQRPLTVGMRVVILAWVERIGTSSFRMAYEIQSAGGEICGTAAIVHACVDPKTLVSMPLPEDFRAALQTRTKP